MDAPKRSAAPTGSFVGDGWRHLAPGIDARSGEGARIFGGRFNTPGSFPALYVCLTEPCAVAELGRLALRQGLSVPDLLPRVLYRYSLSLTRVLDLSREDVRAAVEIEVDALTAEDWSVCQLLDVTAHALGIQAIRTPSATGTDDVLVIFTQNIDDGTVNPRLETRWDSVSDLP